MVGPAGKFAPLHKFNPVRLGFIRDQAACPLSTATANRSDRSKG